MGIKNYFNKIGGKVGDRVAKLSSLSPKQVEDVQLQKEEYLMQMPSKDDEVARAITERMMAASSIEIFNAYLPQIKDFYLPINSDNGEETGKFDTNHNIRYFNITKWVTDKKENNIEKLVNVYAVLSNENCNIALVFNRTQENTNVYLAVVNLDNSSANTTVENYKERLIEAIKGNFPGSECIYSLDEDKAYGIGVIPCMNNEKEYSVATASNIPTEKSEKFISQTIEKLLDGVVPDSKKKEYTIVLLATPINDVEERKLRLGEFHSGLTPYASWSTNFTYSENNMQSSSATVGVNVGASAGIQNGQNYAVSDSEANTDSSSITDSTNASETLGKNTSEAVSDSTATSKAESVTDTLGTGSSDNLGGSVGLSAEGSVGLLGTGVSRTINASVNYNHTWSSTTSQALGKTATDTITKGLTNTIGESIAKTTGTSVANTVGKAVTKALASTSGTNKGTNFGANFGANFARSSTITAMIGKNEGITQNFANFNIKHALDLLENQMKRLEQSSALGMWDFAAYVLSEDQNVANNVAHSYLALTLGEESYMSKSAINLWRGKIDDEKSTAKEICRYVRELRHPLFGLNPEIVKTDLAYNTYPTVVTATTCLSGKELAYSLNFPQKSISGLPVLECAEFGRNVVTFDAVNKEDDNYAIGNVFHMNHVENNQVKLSKNSLASHTFITGSTGSGKSNTVYQLIHKTKKSGIKFLVIEPAKGEYKNVFGNDDSVSVFGTNPKIMPLLRINPFSFPNDIHVLEHMDRIIEIFNVCWPMYAAMPAVLKNAVEKSYVDCGWDIISSTNKYNEKIYPSFEDVANNIKNIIDSSDYDAENKGAYKGSLLTRLQSLSNGINGLIFSADEILDEYLFDENVIIDLSRVGSSETKALIMGILILKLQEYRMSKADNMNFNLKHITVLEEAHNILRRTSTEQQVDSSNLMGKSVEMLANAIAEMRTYGEGFIIADQAPGLMDMSVIRNTNTKIIKRLPDQSDRELVGRAANLNDDQIKELAKLPCGVGAIYQNEWVQPVLCKVDKYDYNNQIYKPHPDYKLSNNKTNVDESLLDCIMSNDLYRRGNKAFIKKLKKKVIESKLSTKVKCDFMDYILSSEECEIDNLRTLLYDLVKAYSAIEISNKAKDIHEFVKIAVDNFSPSLKGYSQEQINKAVYLILHEQSIRDASYKDVLSNYVDKYEKGVIF